MISFELTVTDLPKPANNVGAVSVSSKFRGFTNIDENSPTQNLAARIVQFLEKKYHAQILTHKDEDF